MHRLKFKYPNLSSSLVHQTVAILKDLEDSAQSPLPPIYQPDWISEEKPTNTSSSGTEISKQHENERDFYEGIAVNNNCPFIVMHG